ncbi:translation initiation factor IF-2 [Streptomyces ossamyceticus]|uniref:translation initiation factor IF-2 n=1 Tax=Streptomyces ossamyceticus TaxID=249581 RepID=UPI003436FF7A
MPGGNPFEDMSHERMLQWLDQANSGTVQAAADRLAKAAEEIHKIAEELKVRPQWVEWKGEGANAFRTWTADLANSTLRLSDFSESSAKWLAQASSAIARAQAAIPRDTAGAEANRVAAASSPNDPDADTISTKSTAELAALAENKEKVRREAAAEMTKLGQAYEFSAVQLNALERPKFPPPPDAVLPPESASRRESPIQVRPNTSVQGVSSGSESATLDSAGARGTPNNAPDGVSRSSESYPHGRVAPLEHVPPTRMGIDSVETLLPDKPTGLGSSPAATGRVDGSATAPQSNFVPPISGVGANVVPKNPAAQGLVAVTGRVPPVPGSVPFSTSPTRTPGGSGVIGGRAVAPPGGPTEAIHRGTVVGAPGATGRVPGGPTAGPMTTGRMVGQQGQTLGRNLPPSTGGVIGGTPQRTGRGVLGAPSSSGVGTTGSDANTSNMRRGGIVGGISNAARPGENRGTNARPGGQAKASAGTNDTGLSPRRSTTDKKPQQQGSGRNVPPVID